MARSLPCRLVESLHYSALLQAQERSEGPSARLLGCAYSLGSCAFCWGFKKGPCTFQHSKSTGNYKLTYAADHLQGPYSQPNSPLANPTAHMRVSIASSGVKWRDVSWVLGPAGHASIHIEVFVLGSSFVQTFLAT